MTSIINQRWPLGKFTGWVSNGKKQINSHFVVYRKKDILKNLIKILRSISLSGTPEKAYFEEFNRYRI